MVTRRGVLFGAAGLVAVAAGGVVLADVDHEHQDRRPVTTSDWEVVLTRAANGLSTDPRAVRAAAADPAPQLLVGVPLTVAEATLLRARRDAVPLAALGRLIDRHPALTRLAPRDRPPSARTVRAWMTRPDRQLAAELYDQVGTHLPVEVHLTRWSRAELDHQQTAASAASTRWQRTTGVEIASIFEPNNSANIEVTTTRALTPAQQRLIHQLAPAAVFSVGSIGNA